MIIGIGIDSVEIKRFEQWHLFQKKTLLKIFDESEINYCLQLPKKSAERFAVRFAAKEAFFKALATSTNHQNSLVTICKNIIIKKNDQYVPYLEVKWHTLDSNLEKVKTHISLTHTKTVATAFVILEKI